MPRTKEAKEAKARPVLQLDASDEDEVPQSQMMGSPTPPPSPPPSKRRDEKPTPPKETDKKGSYAAAVATGQAGVDLTRERTIDSAVLGIANELRAFMEAENVSSEWGYTRSFKEPGDNPRVAPRRSIISNQIHLGDDASQYALQVLGGYDPLKEAITIRLMVSNSWTATKQKRDELGNPSRTFWFRKQQLNYLDRGTLEEALATDETEYEGEFDPTGLHSWPTHGLYLPIGILQSLVFKFGDIFDLIKETTNRMKFIVENNPKRKEGGRLWSLFEEMVAEMKAEAMAKLSNNKYYAKESGSEQGKYHPFKFGNKPGRKF